MSQQHRFLPLSALVLALWISRLSAADKVSLDNLLPQMTDLSLLVEYPDPPYVARQFSSYDRASEAPGKESWFANADRGFMLYDGVLKKESPYFKTGPMQGRAADGRFPAGTRVGISPTHKRLRDYVWAYATTAEGSAQGDKIPQGYVARSAITMDPQGHVLADMDGPGCVVNIWSANPKDAGNVRIYLDGAEKPVIEAKLEALLGGKWKTTIDGKETIPFPDPIACERSRGFNLYFPIAYARHCKITIDRPNIYYHVDYRTYPAGTEVETFSMEALATIRQQVQKVAERLRAPFGRGTLRIQGNPDAAYGPGDLEPGQVRRITLDGPKAIRVLGARLSHTEKTPDSKPLPPVAWRSLFLEVTFDGAPRPQVSCPLGDFFGSSPGMQEYESLPLSVDSRGFMSSHWYMPFEKSAVIEVRNRGNQTFQLELGALAEPYKWTDRSMHFYAKWRAETLKSRPFSDWTYCDLNGKGVFVGDMLSLMNPVRAWWGEGDEKIYVDGESFPSWFGTGSEDYYGYAWSDPKPFQHAYHNQTRCDGPGNRGYTSVNRFHILDAIPFTKSFRFDMEFWHWAPNIEVPHAATSYWYARRGATDDFKAPDEHLLTSLPTSPAPPAAYRIKDAIEGEHMKILAKSGEFPATPQDMREFSDGKWSGDSHLWARPTRAGEWVDLELPVRKDGPQQVIVYLTKSNDYGIVQFQVNGKKLGKPIDTFSVPNVISTGPIDLGTVNLKKGPATLRVEVIGTNPKSDSPHYMWGLDCVVLKPTSDYPFSD